MSEQRLTLYGGRLPEGGPPLHVHDFDEALLILEGRLVVQLDDELDELSDGDFVWMARGHQHTFANPGPGMVRAMGLAIPSGIEDLFSERLGYLSKLDDPTAPDLSRMAEIYAAHASRVVGPPLSI